MTSANIELNGVVLLAADDGTLPSLDPINVTISSPVTLVWLCNFFLYFLNLSSTKCCESKPYPKSFCCHLSASLAVLCNNKFTKNLCWKLLMCHSHIWFFRLHYLMLLWFFLPPPQQHASSDLRFKKRNKK